MKTLTEKELVNLVKSDCKTEEPITKAARIAGVAYLCGFHNGLTTCSEYINRHDNAHAKL